MPGGFSPRTGNCSTSYLNESPFMEEPAYLTVSEILLLHEFSLA